MPWSLTKLFPRLGTNRGYLDCFPTVCPFVVIHSITGTLLCPLPILDYLVLNSFVGFILISRFYFSLRWYWALSFPFGFHFYFVGRFSLAEYCFLCFPGFVTAFSSLFLFPPESFRELLGPLCCKASCSTNISSCLQTVLSAVIQALSVGYSSVESHRSASFRICCSTICCHATPLIPTCVL